MGGVWFMRLKDIGIGSPAGNHSSCSHVPHTSHTQTDPYVRFNRVKMHPYHGLVLPAIPYTRSYHTVVCPVRLLMIICWSSWKPSVRLCPTLFGSGPTHCLISFKTFLYLSLLRHKTQCVSITAIVQSRSVIAQYYSHGHMWLYTYTRKCGVRLYTYRRWLCNHKVWLHNHKVYLHNYARTVYSKTQGMGITYSLFPFRLSFDAKWK